MSDCGEKPVAWMWQHGETGMCGFLEDAPQADLDRWQRINAPRKIVAPLFTRPAAQPVPQGMVSVQLIATERRRQIDQEGWSAEHDAEHDAGEMACAAAAYAVNAADQLHPYSQGDGDNRQLPWWPWSPEWWKPKDPLRDLVRAGALIAAEIDKLLSAAKGTPT